MSWNRRNLTGFVLTGGQSRRMGYDKALLRWGKYTLLERALDLLKDLCQEVAVVGAKPAYQRFDVHQINDLFPGYGPLAGIHAGLANSQTEYNLFIPCDMPALTTDYLRLLADEAFRTRAPAVVACSKDGKLIPVCGVYHRSCFYRIEEALRTGHLTAAQVVTELGAKALPAQQESLLYNVNTPEDWQHWLARAGGSP